MKEDNKIFWKFIKSKTKAKESIPCILDDEGGINTDDKTKSELLNKFFVTFAFFQVSGSFPVCIDILKICANGVDMLLDVSFKNLGALHN
jgi:hypothetical protein